MIYWSMHYGLGKRTKMTARVHVTVAHPGHGQPIIGRSRTGYWIEIYDHNKGIGKMVEWKPLGQQKYNLLNSMKGLTQSEWKTYWEKL